MAFYLGMIQNKSERESILAKQDWMLLEWNLKSLRAIWAQHFA
ncbi:hypothetical protein LEP1GSC170_0513 [Leptospira interrogans serovar Bataviae str. HAI135]|nr:hypothetical protein LEP1GSC170_0513 [Leptospira interrogans serovar Bataviae str. HAI135]